VTHVQRSHGIVVVALSALIVQAEPMTTENHTLTAVPGITVGHITLGERPTGCTVVLAGPAAVAGVDVRGAAPGTRETDLLSPVNTIDRVHAIVLAGGSAFGLDVATGTVRWLEERGVGFETSFGRVPIVPSAILFDLGVGDPKVRPTADCGYRAAANASAAPVPEGSVGAGAGATVGKMSGLNRAMKGGIGSAAIVMPGGLIVAALVAVNAYGDIIDPATGAVVAGVRTEDGRALADARRLLRASPPAPPRTAESTTLAVVATNARLTKTQAVKLAQMAHDGFARAIWPVHTPADGDTVFTLATAARSEPDDLLLVGALAADVTAEAIIRAVRAATSVRGIPAAGDLGR
jgi:L-aminopeptidase/D-esterase-like protein